MKTVPVIALDPDTLRSVMRAWSAGVTVVAAAHDGDCHGMTVNSFTSISLDPPLITVTLQQNTHTHELVMKSRAFGLTILAAGQKRISDLFAGRLPESDDRFSHVRTETLVTGSPLIAGGLSWMDCRLVHAHPAGENTLFIAAVAAARVLEEGEPLIYHNREYWRLSRLD